MAGVFVSGSMKYRWWWYLESTNPHEGTASTIGSPNSSYKLGYVGLKECDASSDEVCSFNCVLRSYTDR